MTVAVAAACWSATGASASAAGTYVALGDSLTAGCCGASPGQGFVDRFFAYLQSPAGGGLDQLSRHAEQDVTDTMLANPQSRFREALNAIGGPSDTRLASVEIGAWDRDLPSCSVATGRGFNAPGCRFAANYVEILDRVSAALARDPGDERLIVVAYYNPATGMGGEQEDRFERVLWGTDGGLDCAGKGLQLGLNDLITCIGLRKGAAVADVYPRIKEGGASMFPPAVGSIRDIHVNAAGHAVMAQVMVQATRPTRLTRLRITPAAFRSSGPASRTGATVAYSLSRTDQIAWRVERRRGSRWVALGRSFARAGEPGANSFRFSGRVGGRALRAGRYRLVATARGAAKGSRPARREFRIVG